MLSLSFFYWRWKMKHIIYLIAGLIILLMVPGYVKAASYQDELNSYDSSLLDQDDNDYSSGEYCFFMLRRWYWSGEPTKVMDKGVVECSDGYCLFWVRNKEDSSGNHWRLVCRKSELSDKKKDIKIDGDGQLTVRSQSRWYKESNGETLSSYDNKEAIIKKDDCFSFYDGASGFEWLVAKTNIPVFDYDSDTFLDDVNKYIKSGGTDYSGSVNSDFINDSKRHESSNVEMPLNFKVTSGMSTGISSAYSIDEDITCHWSQSVDTSDYEYEYQCRVTVEQVKTSGKNDYNKKEFNSGWVKFGNAAYNGADTINLKIEAKQMDNLVTKIMLASQQTDNPLRYKGYLVTRIELRIRNIDRASSENDCSRWVCFTTTRGGSYSNSGKPDKVTVEDDEGNDFSEDSDYTEDYDPVDRDNISNVSSFKGNISYFLDLIRNGFGFTGNHGLISLFSAWFSWLPSGFVSIVMVGFGLIIFVAVVRIVLNFLT